ncbi:MAG: hypothetical protein KKI09_16035 [Spirochaetes bacterium]|nr:hypothetical protein [Spirochaetota bacterium]MBU0956933.1 hypothetical protein [Spirochaetota bacterium]
MRWFYILLPIVMLAWVFIRGRHFRRERGHLVNPPKDLFGRWEADGWQVEIAPEQVRIVRPDGSELPIDAVLKQSYKRAYVIVQSHGILVEKIAFIPMEINEKRVCTGLLFMLQKDVRTLTKLMLRRKV